MKTTRKAARRTAGAEADGGRGGGRWVRRRRGGGGGTRSGAGQYNLFSKYHTLRELLKTVVFITQNC